MAPTGTSVSNERPSLLFIQWWIVILTGLVFGVSGALYVFLTPPAYEASALVQLDPTSVAVNQDPDEVTSQEVATQALVIDSEVITQQVIETLNLDESVRFMQMATSVEQVNDSRVLRVSTTWDSPDGAIAVSDAYSQAYIDYRIEQRDERLEAAGPDSGLTPGAAGSIITPAISTGEPAGLSPGLVIALSVVLGLLVGLLAAYAREALRGGSATPRRRSNA